MTGGLGHRLSSDELNDPFSLAGAQRPPRPIETDFGGPRNKSAKDYGHYLIWTLPPQQDLEDFHLQAGAPCRAHIE
jgi:hypothetical protein